MFLLRPTCVPILANSSSHIAAPEAVQHRCGESSGGEHDPLPAGSWSYTFSTESHDGERRNTRQCHTFLDFMQSSDLTLFGAFRHFLDRKHLRLPSPWECPQNFTWASTSSICIGSAD